MNENNLDHIYANYIYINNNYDLAIDCYLKLIYNEYTPYSNPLVSYNYIKYGLIDNLNNFTEYKNTDSSINKITIKDSEYSAINGTYTGTNIPNYNNKFRYRKINGNEQIYWSGSLWIITDGIKTFYQSPSQTEYPWQSIRWYSPDTSGCCCSHDQIDPSLLFSGDIVLSPNKFLNLQIENK